MERRVLRYSSCPVIPPKTKQFLSVSSGKEITDPQMILVPPAWWNVCRVVFCSQKVSCHPDRLEASSSLRLWSNSLWFHEIGPRAQQPSRIPYLRLQRPCEINQFSSVAQSYLTLCNPMDCSTPGFPVHHQFPELTQTHVHQVRDAIQPSHPLLSPSPPAFNLSQHQGLF